MAVSCQKIDLPHWPRNESFSFFSSLDQPFYSVCFRVDVTALHAYTKANGLSFYHAMIWLVTQAVNETENLRYTLRSGEVYLLPARTPSFTELKKGSEQFRILTVPWDPSLSAFCHAAKEKSERQTAFLEAASETDDLLYLSCLPWFDLTCCTNERNFDKEKDEKINTIIKINENETYKCLLFSTKEGLVKRTLISEFDNIRQSGKIAITLKEDDELISVKKTTGNDQVLMCSSNGRMARFSEEEIRIMGRTASGVRGINLTDDKCVGMEISEPGKLLLVVTERGYGKKTPIEEYRETKRGSKGVKTINITEKNGKVIGFKSTDNEKDLMIITDDGIIIRMDINSISQMGRVTKGVRLINLKEKNKVASVSVIEKEENSIEEE